jgi:hypothetical protein
MTRIETAKTRSSLIGTLGLQLQIGRLAPFAQAAVMPTRGSGEFLINGQGFAYYLEGGLRFNFGSAVERLRCRRFTQPASSEAATTARG